MKNWGIIGTGAIAYDVAYAIQSIKDNQIIGVSSRKLENAKQFANNLSIPNKYDDVQSLIQNPDIQIIYIATPNALHYQNIVACFENGKHVLCEKPLVLSVDEAKEIARISKEKGLFLMEAMWTRFIPTIEKMIDLVKKGEIGKIRMIQGSFGAILQKDRCFNKSLGGGAIWDLGVYLVSLTHTLLGDPQKVDTNIVNGNGGVDTNASIALTYSSGAIATLNCSYEAQLENTFIVYGTKGMIKVGSPFYRSSILEISSFGPIEDKPHQRRNPYKLLGPLKNAQSLKERVFHTLGKNSKKIVIPFHGNGYHYQIEEVLNCINNKNIESPKMPLSHSISVINIISQALN